MEHGHKEQSSSHYRGLVLMAVLSFAAMYALMYAMVDRLEHALPNLNQAYMAGLMAAPMVLIELLVMRGMYRDTKVNAVVIALSLVVLLGCLAAIRAQAGIADKQFLRSMIPHHASAILMCEASSIHDPEIQDLCRRIRASQQAEIDLMKAKLKALEH